MSVHKVVFRVDASREIGTGHVMRCFALAEALRKKHINVEFACVPFQGNLLSMLKDKGYFCYELNSINDLVPTDGEWLIVDHYALDQVWESKMREAFQYIMVIDDLANRKHNCDILLDQNQLTDSTQYDQLVPEKCLKFFGPQYALLREEFVLQARKRRSVSSKVRSIVVSFGGTDPSGETWKFLQWWNSRDVLLFNQKLIVVIGMHVAHKKEIVNYCRSHSEIELHIQSKNIAKIFRNADVGIGAGGISLWERCCMLLPTITFVVAQNQKEATAEAVKKGLTILAEDNKKNWPGANPLKKIVMDEKIRLEMIFNMKKIFGTALDTGVEAIVRAVLKKI